MSEDSRELVFVCGPLRQDGSHASVMDARAEWVGPVTAKGSLYAIGWVPAFLPGKGEGKVVGELYRVTPELLSELDEFETKASGEINGAGCRRVKVEAGMLSMAGERRFEAWAWEWQGPVEDRLRIASGDWVDFASPRVFPWFTWIAAACVIAFPAGTVGAVLLELSKGGIPRIVSGVLDVIILGAPFAALGAIWFGWRAREAKGLLGCIGFFAFFGAIVSTLVMLKWLAHLLR